MNFRTLLFSCIFIFPLFAVDTEGQLNDLNTGKSNVTDSSNLLPPIDNEINSEAIEKTDTIKVDDVKEAVKSISKTDTNSQEILIENDSLAKLDKENNITDSIIPQKVAKNSSIDIKPVDSLPNSVKGKFVITSKPDSAIILINKKRVGNTPLSIDTLTPGDYSVLILKSGYNKVEKNISYNGMSDTLSVILSQKQSLTSTNTASVVKSEKVLTDSLNDSVNQKVSAKDSLEDVDKHKKKKIAVIIGSVLFALFTTLVIITEFAGE